jgi:hypothetical protein
MSGSGLISFKDLCEEIYEDSNARVEKLAFNDSLRISLVYEQSPSNDAWREVTLEADDVVEHSISASFFQNVSWLVDHPLLWKHNCEHATMFFSSPCERPFELLGRLYERHQAVIGDWRNMAEYVTADSERLCGGYGEFAKGPRRLIDEYAAVAAHFLKYTIVHGYTPPAGYGLLMFDDGFVVCKSVRVIGAQAVPIPQ